MMLKLVVCVMLCVGCICAVAQSDQHKKVEKAIDYNGDGVKDTLELKHFGTSKTRSRGLRAVPNKIIWGKGSDAKQDTTLIDWPVDSTAFQTFLYKDITNDGIPDLVMNYRWVSDSTRKVIARKRLYVDLADNVRSIKNISVHGRGVDKSYTNAVKVDESFEEEELQSLGMGEWSVATKKQTFNKYTPDKEPLINIEESQYSVTAVPNPALHYFRIELSGATSEKNIQRISCVDTQGKMMLSLESTGKEDMLDKSFDCSNWANGVYTIVVTLKNNVQLSTTLMVQR